MKCQMPQAFIEMSQATIQVSKFRIACISSRFCKGKIWNFPMENLGYYES